MEAPIRNNLVIELHIPDFKVAKEFYPKIGFNLISEDPVGEHLGYLVFEHKDPAGNTLLNFYGGDSRVSGHSFFKNFPAETPKGYGVEITIPVSDVDAYYKHVSSVVPDSIVQELTTKRWGKKDFRIKDPFGFYLRFTELVDWGQQ